MKYNFPLGGNFLLNKWEGKVILLFHTGINGKIKALFSFSICVDLRFTLGLF
jgi:hypothetical protein